MVFLKSQRIYAVCRHFIKKRAKRALGTGDIAEELYEYFIEYANGKFAKVQHGVFGAEMSVELVNSGPFTVILED
ncbi:MAG: D-aminoacyl-tRNA deacylase [Defluviitaleaceae bacterium]|nr:D-aminoacyl-tRNA deacylase [Defluviitaleaceae bacterium]